MLERTKLLPIGGPDRRTKVAGELDHLLSWEETSYAEMNIDVGYAQKSCSTNTLTVLFSQMMSLSYGGYGGISR